MGGTWWPWRSLRPRGEAGRDPHLGPGSSWAAEEGTWCEARPLCPGGKQAAGVLSPRNSECIDREQPPPEQTWDRCGARARASPASPLHRSWCGSQQRSQGLQDQCRPIQRRLSRAMLGPGASLGTETWGQVWGSAPSHPPLSLPLLLTRSPGATHPPDPATQTERVAPLNTEEPLVQPWVGFAPG